MKNEVKDGILEIVLEEQTEEIVHVITHQLVTREGTESTSMRSVYDQSATFSSEVSLLNDCLQNELS